MTAASASNQDRLIDLLVAQALQGLHEADARELSELLREHPEREDNEFEVAAAALHLAIAAPAADPVPDSVTRNLERAASEWVRSLPSNGRAGNHAGASNRPVAGSSPDVLARLNAAPWLLAAACLTLAVFIWLTSPAPVETLPAARQYERFVSTDAPPDLVRAQWQPVAQGYEIPEGFRGEVVWSDSRNEGYMVFDGLPPNDPNVEQFQLWVFDATRDEAHPVDGGVFNVEDSGRVVVPITPKITVRTAAAFAVTIEKPGGVVVSSRQRIATLAPVEPG